jgi:hypothetical protein
MKKQKTKALVLGSALSIIVSTFGASKLHAETWGVDYAGVGPYSLSCSGWNMDYSTNTWTWSYGSFLIPAFVIYTITYPSDWPWYSELGQELYWHYSTSRILIHSDSKANTPSGVDLTKLVHIATYDADSWHVVESHHWGVYNGNYVEASSSAGGYSSPCMYY